MNCPKCGMDALPDETISAVGFAYCKSCGMLWSAWAHAEMDRLKQELATEREKVRRLREGLKKLEWCDLDHGNDCCPVCGKWSPAENNHTWKDTRNLYGHRPDCWLAALLEEGK